MNLGRFAALWPVCLFSCLTIVVLVPPIVGIIFWNSTMNHIGAEIDSNSATFDSVMMSKVNQTAETLMSLTPTATPLARVCTSFVKTNLSFSDVQTKMGPLMFQAKLLVPNLSEVSYIGVDGLFFSYITEGNDTYSLYSNSTLSSNQTWFKQLVDPVTGNPIGDAVKYPALLTTKESWFRDAFKSPDGEFAVLEPGWNENRDPMFLRTARVGGVGLVSLGFGVQGPVGIFSNVDLRSGSLFLVSGDTVLLRGFRDTELSISDGSVLVRVVSPRGKVVETANVSCSTDREMARPTASIVYQAERYKLFCSPVEILGIRSAYIIAVVDNPMGRIHKKMEDVRVILVVLIVALLIAIVVSIFVTMRAARREMHLCAKLIDQMEATRQAETKSMSKSTAFANASHDIRASLAGIIGLIDISYSEVLPGSDLEKNLNLMDGSAKDLLELLNSVLDTSKIEVGKMLLEEEEFNLAQLLEDIVDSYHTVASKKHVDLILDPCDGSIIRNSMVRGDKLKLRQIISNLLSNAVKFTPDGHISVRAWARKPSIETSIIVDNQRGWRRRFAGLFRKNSNEGKEMKKVFERNPKAMEFAFEVDDTGKGIPKEQQKLVFENYIQVKETSHGLGGTGLGLGIVQSLVRLMGGDIKIIDKEIGEKGTCFRFNVFLELSIDTDHIADPCDEDVKQRCHSMRLPTLTIRRSNSEGSSSRFLSPRPEASTIVLLIQDDERRKIAQTFMERLGIKVTVAKDTDDLRSVLKNTKRKLNHSRDSSSGKSEERSRSRSSSYGGAKDFPLSSMDGSDQILPVFRRVRGVVLLVIDTSSGPFPQLLKVVSQFRKGLQSGICRVVWLDKASSRVISRGVINEGKLDPSDIVMSQPFHGTRLLDVIKILPEFSVSGSKKRRDSGEIREISSPLPQEGVKNQVLHGSGLGSGSGSGSGSSSNKPLFGKKVLLAEDNEVLALTTRTILVQLGATFERCKNGEEAVELVFEVLRQGQFGGTNRPYDFILMDCEMPIMDGLEATRRIREAEKECNNLHIPIIALTAHSVGDETRKMYAAGMDFHLEKPLRKDTLMEVLVDWKVV